MAANTVNITLTAKDGASQTFKAVSREAQNLDKSLDQVGTKGSRSLDGISKAGAAMGAAFSVVTGALGEAARLAAESEASQARLETAIENTGHSLIEYEDQLSAASNAALQLGFDDEDAADSMALLTSATGDTEQAIADLAVAEDLARARGISLEAATKLVVAAEQGRVGALARSGIAIDENASSEEALAAIREQTAGAADAYADTTQGAIDRVTNAIENQAEAVGAALGPFQSFFALAPAIGPAFSGASTAIGALAPKLTTATGLITGLTTGLGPVGLAAAALAAGGALLYFSGILDDEATAAEKAKDATDEATAALIRYQQANSTLAILQKETNEDLGYIIGSTDTYAAKLEEATAAQERANYELNAAENHFYTGNQSLEELQATYDSTTKTLNDLTAQQADYSISADDLAAAQAIANDVIADTGPAGDLARDILHRLNDEVESGELTWPKYVERVLDLGVQLPIMTQNMIEATAATKDQRDETERAEAAADAYATAQARATDGTHDLGMGFRNLTEEGAAWNTALADNVRLENEAAAAERDHLALLGEAAGFLRDATGAQRDLNLARAEAADVAAKGLAADAVRETAAAIREQAGAYAGLADGITTAKDAQAAFKETQDGIIASQEPYSGQLSEYQTQLGYITDAVDLLNQRQAEGQTLTQDQTDFLADATWAQERLTGGTEDATLALGEQALQYAENMRIGDEMNQTMGDQVGATQTLTDTMNNLIAALQGIPGYVSTYINVDAQDALNQTNHIRNQLDALNGKTSYAHVVITGYYTGPNVGLTPGNLALGGMIDPEREPQHAQHGASLRGWSWVGEAGPELIRAPGAQVLPHTASMAVTSGGGGGQVYHINRMTVVANDPVQFNAKMRSYTAGLER